MSDNSAPAPGKRRSRKSIAAIPSSTSSSVSTTANFATVEVVEGSKENTKPKKKSRSKSLGPGGLEANGIKAGSDSSSGNGRRRESLAPTTAVKSILKPTLPLSPLKPIPSHRTRSGRPSSIPPFTMASTNPPAKPSSSSSSSTSSSKPTATPTSSTTATGGFSFNPPPATVPVRTEEEQQRRAAILAARAARRQSLGNRRVSFAPEATLHTWDVDYGGVHGTPGSSSSGSAASTPANSRNNPGDLSTIEATPTETSLPNDTPVRLPENLADPQTPLASKGVGSPQFSSPFSSSPESAFGGLPMDDDESGSELASSDDDEEEDEPGAGDRTFMTMQNDETMGEMTMDMDVDDDTVTGAGFGAFGTRKAWQLEGGTETVDSSNSSATPKKAQEEQGQEEQEAEGEGGGEMSMDITRAVGGVLPVVVEYPALPKADSPNDKNNKEEDDGGEMTMDMTRAIGGVLQPDFTNPYVEKDNEEEADMTMDMTRPVGGILSAAAGALQRATRRSLGFFSTSDSTAEKKEEQEGEDKEAGEQEEDDGDGMTMDMTVAIGGILSKAPEAQKSPETAEQPPSSPPGEDMTVDMDMTVAVGGILSKAPEPAPAPTRQTARFESSSPHPSSDDGNEEMTMEFTSVIGGIIDGARTGGRRSSLATGGGKGKLISGSEWAKQQEAQAQKAQSEGKENKDKEQQEEKEEEDADMDFTVAVGGILSNPSTLPSKSQDSDDDGDVEMDMDGMTMEMDMTTAIGSILPPIKPTDKQDEWAPVSAPAPVAVEQEVTSSPTPAKRGGRSRKNSVTSAASPRVTRSAKKTPNPAPEEKKVTPEPKEKETTVTSTPTPAQKRQTPRKGMPKSKPVTPKAEAPKAAELAKPATPQPEAPQTTSPETPPIEPVKPSKAFVFATPQKKSPLPPPPSTPPNQATPAIPPRPKTPSKHTPAIQTPLRQVSTGFSLSVKKALAPTSPSPANRITAPPGSPGATRGVGINKLGLGSPHIAAKLERRRSLVDSVPFSPGKASSELISARKADEKAEREEEKRQKELEVERRKGLDLKSRIDLLTPKKVGRKSLAYGALLQQTKREREEQGGYLGGGKRRKSDAGGRTPKNTGTATFDFDKAPSLPIPEGRTPRKKTVTISINSSPMAPPPKPEEGKDTQPDSDSSDEEPQETAPKLTLTDFLSLTSISFLDGLSTTSKRRPMIPAAAPTEATLADCVIAASCTVPMLDLFQHSCRELKTYIREGVAIVKDIEADTEEDNPPLFSDYLGAPPDIRVLMDAQFREAKTHARCQARGVWYEWRAQLMRGVRGALEANLAGMKNDELILEEARMAAKSTLPALRARFEAAKKTADKLEDARRRAEEDDKVVLQTTHKNLQTTSQRIEALKQKLLQRSAELSDINAQIEVKTARKIELQEAIDEATRIKEQNRGWSEDEIAAWAEKAKALEKSSGWSIAAVQGSVVELSFLRQLRVFWDATGKENGRVEYTTLAIRKPSDPLPLEGAERDFYVAALNAKLASDTKRALKATLALVDTFWRRCLSVSGEIEKVRKWYPVDLKLIDNNRLLVAIKVLVVEIRSKVVIEVTVDSDLGIKSGAKVIYGSVNGEAVGEYVSKSLNGEGAWRKVIDNVVGRCVEGKRRGGVGVPTKT